jgi:hypothetical protein
MDQLISDSFLEVVAGKLVNSYRIVNLGNNKLKPVYIQSGRKTDSVAGN